jgi:hypothetical protein
MTMPMNEGIKLLAREAGFAAGKELLAEHAATCEARKVVGELALLRDSAVVSKVVKRKVGHWLHWVVAGVLGGVLFASGEWVWNQAVTRVDPPKAAVVSAQR